MTPKTLAKLLMPLAGVALVALLSASAPPSQMPPRTPDGGVAFSGCTDCHSCAAPNQNKLCLWPCPRLFVARQTAKHELAEAPSMISIDSLSSEFGPVKFQHKLHAGMSEMGGSCATCHHYSPAGKVEACRKCHAKVANPAELRQPGLKGAYHRQCMQCHREWSHETDCNVCHLRRDDTTPRGDAAVVQDKTDLMGRPHPVQPAPEKRVYVTPYAKGPTVTFYHKQHIDLFGLRCVSCHREESCSNCHDLKVPAPKKTMEQVHAVCSGCHKADSCAKCHDTVERPGFSHASTGWALNRFHQPLDCHACHPTGKPIAKLPSHECTSCHGGWKQGVFRHGATGLQLNKRHSKQECEDCHPNRKFDKPPNCTGCHDDKNAWRKEPPGTMTSTK